MEHLIDGNVRAVSLLSGPYYSMQQLGFRKVLDTSLMMDTMVADDASLKDIEKYFAALRREQVDIDQRRRPPYIASRKSCK